MEEVFFEYSKSRGEWFVTVNGKNVGPGHTFFEDAQKFYFTNVAYQDDPAAVAE